MMIATDQRSNAYSLLKEESKANRETILRTTSLFFFVKDRLICFIELLAF